MESDSEMMSEKRLHSEEMEEIIAKVPNWLLRWGVMFFLGILLVCLGFAHFVQYPDEIRGNLRFESTGITRLVIAPTLGEVTMVFVKQRAFVKRGQPIVEIATFDGNANHYLLNAPADGVVGFVSIVQPGRRIEVGQQLFNIHSRQEQFFGMMKVSASNINRLRIGQEVLVVLKEPILEKNERLKGYVTYIADDPDKEGLFEIKVTFRINTLPLTPLKTWMTGDARIFIGKVSILERLYENLYKGIK
jgi:multidrug resistance efflux pump